MKTLTSPISTRALAARSKRSILTRAVALALTAAGASLIAAVPAQAADNGQAAQKPLEVVTSFSVLADLARQVGGDRVSVESLIKPGGDPHVFQPGPAQVRQLAGANLFVINGLGLEGWMSRLKGSSGFKGPVVVASHGIKTRKAEGNESEHHHHHGELDPHAWHDVENVRHYVSNIAEGLCKASPADCTGFQERAHAYDQKLQQLDQEIHSAIDAIPAEKRRVMVSHSAFGYYGRAYQIKFMAPVGVSTEEEPSAATVGTLIREARRQKVHAFFFENNSDPRLLKRMASELKNVSIGELYADSLSPADGPAGDYISMMNFNTKAITGALAH